MFINQILSGVLRDQAGDGTGSGGGGTPAPVSVESITELIKANNVSLMGDLTKTVNGLDKKWNIQFEKFKPQQSQDSDGTGDGTGTGQQGTGQQNGHPAIPEAITREMAKLRKDLDESRELTKRETQTRIAQEREVALTNSLEEAARTINPAGWSAPTSSKSALTVFKGLVSYDEQGNVVTPDGSDLKAYLTESLKNTYRYFVAPLTIGGSGAKNGGMQGQNRVDINSIKPGISDEDMKRVNADIIAALRT